MTELLNCPFCGGFPKLFQPSHQAIVRCQKCCAEVEGAQGDKDHAIAAWNKRAVDPKRQALVEALKAALTAIDAFWPKDAPENESQASEDRAVASVRKQARAALTEAGEL